MAGFIADTRNIGKNETGRKYLLSLQESLTAQQYEYFSFLEIGDPSNG
ncbi:hypothetical protein ACFL6W_07335 [Thermodesulfobacteriota bacterium]